MTRVASPSDYLRLARGELRDIVDYAADLSSTDLTAQSLCADWRTIDVLGHLAWGASSRLSSLLAELARTRFRPSVALSRAAIDYAHANDTATILGTLATLGAPGSRFGSTARLAKPQEFLVDYLVHHFDIRRPLGDPRQPPEDRLLAGLQVAPTLGGLMGCKRRVRDLRLVATDVDWTHGDGPLVEGRAEALLLAMTGRPAALSELAGDGVATIGSRTVR